MQIISLAHRHIPHVEKEPWRHGGHHWIDITTRPTSWNTFTKTIWFCVFSRQVSTHARALMPRSSLHRASTRNAIHFVYSNSRIWQHRPLLGYQLAGNATLLHRRCTNSHPAKSSTHIITPFGQWNKYNDDDKCSIFLCTVSSCNGSKSITKSS